MSETIHDKLHKIAYSFIMVYNPTDEDYIVEWGKSGVHQWGSGGQTGEPSHPWVIPNKNRDAGYGLGKKEVPFYIANKYYNEMSDKLINEEADNISRFQRTKFKRDPSEYGTWWESNWKSFVDLEGLKKKYKTELILGITKEYADELPETMKPNPKQDETVETFENLPKYSKDEITNQNKEAFIKEVTSE